MKKSKNIFSLLLLLWASSPLLAQRIKGVVQDGGGEANGKTLPGASIIWKGTQKGVSSKPDGTFSLEVVSGVSELVVSYVGYLSDTLRIENPEQFLTISLTPDEQLQEVEVVGRTPESYYSIEPVNAQILTSKALQKAACCNLSESFETNASVDVHFSDAVTGAKQIQMLGLSGNYTQILIEGMPALRGLATTYGLGYIPGNWMESIQISKGVSSVLSGYESMAGQINLELKKPEDSEKFFLNMYANHMSKVEGNINASQKIGDKWSTMVLFHAETFQNRVDDNKDNFLDMPLMDQVNLINRWKYDGDRLKIQFGVKALLEDRIGGELDYRRGQPVQQGLPYGLELRTNRFEAFMKTSILYPERPYARLGWIQSATFHQQDGFFGIRSYNGEQRTYYSNLIYQTIIGNTFHQVKMGTSFLYDDYRENFMGINLERTEVVPGIFGEYAYIPNDRFTAMVGIRNDFHNLFGNQFSPRFHLMYHTDDHTTLRLSGGRGFRVANILAENTPVMVSSRRFEVEEALRPEEAINFGLNLTRHFHIGNRELTVNVDLYRTAFQNQVIVDMDRDAQGVYFYNLNGRSFSNSFQVEAAYEVFERFDVTAAYRLNDVRMTFSDQLLESPFISRHTGLVNVAYATLFEKWKFDLTANIRGSSRIPDTSGSPADFQLDSRSPAFVILHGQITKKFKRFDAYIGGENLLNFIQPNPILAANDPWAPNFDASLVWGPIFGRMFYTGFRFTIP